MDKALILQEIERTVKANEGKALGRNVFSSQTGIKPSEWCAYWARWGDALREAGFAPNQFQASYGKRELLEKYANLALELGRLPVEGELRLKARRDSEFLSHSTFLRLGKKAERISQLLEFCRNHERYKNIVPLCEAYIQHTRRLNDEPRSLQELQTGFVYLIKSGRFYKIGMSNSAGRRSYEIALQLPEKTSTVHSIRTDDPIGIEAYWHKRFQAKRKNGEWFNLDASDIAAFKRRKFM